VSKCPISKDWSSLYIDGYGVWVLPPTALYNAQDGFRAQRENRFPKYMQSLGAMPLPDLLELAARAEAAEAELQRVRSAAAAMVPHYVLRVWIGLWEKQVEKAEAAEEQATLTWENAERLAGFVKGQLAYEIDQNRLRCQTQSQSQNCPDCERDWICPFADAVKAQREILDRHAELRKKLEGHNADGDSLNTILGAPTCFTSGVKDAPILVGDPTDTSPDRCTYYGCIHNRNGLCGDLKRVRGNSGHCPDHN